VNNSLNPSFAKLTEKERMYGIFQQHFATAHMAHAVWKQCARYAVTT
jgi:hypothetical protein